MARLLFIDAYDSFAQNIKALLYNCLENVEITEIKIDTFTEQSNCLVIDSDDDESVSLENPEAGIFTSKNRFLSVEQLLPAFDAIILGPGPGNPQTPSDVGLFNHVWRTATVYEIPVLGICLGFQSLCLFHGIPVGRMFEPCHGQTKKIRSAQQDIFLNVDGLEATNYNSLAVYGSSFSAFEDQIRPTSSDSSDSSNSDNSFNSSSTTSTLLTPAGLAHRRGIEVLAWDDENYVMAVKHMALPFWGVQFHPESCKSNQACHELVRNWWCKAKEHNDQRRKDQLKLFSQIPMPLDKLQVDDKYHTNEELETDVQDSLFLETTSPLCSLMLKMTENSTDRVQHLSTKIDLNEEQISEICHGLSSKKMNAMLNSTRKGRFSIYAVTDQLSWTVEYGSKTCTIHTEAGTDVSMSLNKPEVMEAVEELIQRRKATGGLAQIPFWGGFNGYLSYEHGLDTIRVTSRRYIPRLVPDISLLWVDRTVVFDHETSMIHVQSIRKNDFHWINSIIFNMKEFSGLSSAVFGLPARYTVKRSIEARKASLPAILDSIRITRPDHKSYIKQIIACQDQLRAGNSYELCLTTEAQVKTPIGNDHSFTLYRNLHQHNPVPFGAYLKLNDITILGTSPEQYLSWSRSGTIDMIPMKGTVKRGPGMTLERATHILSSPKESAENLMIADLIRHDLYNTVGFKSKVEVVKLCEVVEHETVYQLVSHIRAHAPIDPNLSNTQKQDHVIHYGHKALRSTVPAGSMTGAPKKRSCEILSAMEDRNRGIYSGVLGFLDVGGGGSWNVCIRSAFSSAKEDIDGFQTWHVGAGGAITVLSHPEAEWEEMTTKLESVLKGFQEIKPEPPESLEDMHRRIMRAV